ncbi:hypothetical protein PR003_g6255 [Phytophthora rubi]|uniref:Uncharacterized protein n=1 Tax=Phytophthora rubi TaxID=129364 RepID=A0A6A3NC35_9STRA|nr:hypothetical protein PR002_g11501 [Phytophthora rubi]KAE9042987.1 hypothetical protein PR001_g5980 [Phytophthora rubi]KAE9348722.1 hypothetical protein PR003_g6255 [Phytophthora rubi]
MHRRPVLTARPRPQVRLAFLKGLASLSPSQSDPVQYTSRQIGVPHPLVGVRAQLGSGISDLGDFAD